MIRTISFLVSRFNRTLFSFFLQRRVTLFFFQRISPFREQLITKQKGKIPVYEFKGTFKGKPAYFKSTSVLGHIYKYGLLF
jgi:hypothetical protein